MLWKQSFLLLVLLPLVVLCAEDYYKLLGVGKQATDRELKKAYRQLSKKYHPDKNPNDDAAKQKFTEVADAYEALSDPELRRIYDHHGEEGVKQKKQERSGPRGAGNNPFDLFRQFFGGGGGPFGGGGGERRGPNMEVRVAIALSDFYNGVDTEFTIDKQVVCKTCDGSGSQDGKMETCNKCGGRGITIQKHQLAPGIYQQMQGTCDSCGGQGRVVRNPCKKCGGARVVKEKEPFQLFVERGMPKGIRIPYENEADESPDYTAGDLIVQLVEQDPQLTKDGLDGAFFRRKGRDLFWREILSLREAWMGDWTRNITHLDGHVVQLGRKRGQVVQPNHVEIIRGEGMPLWQERAEDKEKELEFGALHVEYIIVLPDKMDSGMEKEFWAVWDKWRKKKGVALDDDLGRKYKPRDEL